MKIEFDFSKEEIALMDASLRATLTDYETCKDTGDLVWKLKCRERIQEINRILEKISQ